VSINAAELSSGTYFGGVWRPKTTGYYAYYGMTAADYQVKHNTYSAQGYRLHKIQGYAGSTRFAAIWVSSPITNLRTGNSEEVIFNSSKEMDKFLSIRPNPASDRGAIDFTLEQAEYGKVVIKDMMGREVHIVTERNFQAGENSVEFATNQLKSGFHIVEYVSKNRRKAAKLIVEKR
jgi:hypothetical protein